jgi:hypothetical protein
VNAPLDSRHRHRCVPREPGRAVLAWTCLLAALAGRAAGADPRPEPGAIRVPVTRDTWLSSVGREADGNNGGVPRLKLKSYQEMSLVDIDSGPLKGRVVQRASLHLRLAGPERLGRVTVGSIAADWVEGTGRNYEPQPGSSSFNRRRHGDVPWSHPGSDLCSVILGQGGTLWHMADATEPDADRWQEVAVDPSVVAARVAGLSHGFLLFDDTGSEWTRQGESFKIHHMPNRFVHSRESGAAGAPYLTIVLGAEDHVPPGMPVDLRSECDDLAAGEARVSWRSPTDEGAAGTLGFFVTADGRDVPRYLIPRAGPPGEAVVMHLRDLDLKPGAEAVLEVRAVDGAGNVGPPLQGRVRLSGRFAAPLPGTSPTVLHDDAAAGPALPRLGRAEVAIIDELDKVQPVTGASLPPQPGGYLAANHLWSARAGRVRLAAARNEFVAFQILVRDPPGELRPELTFPPGAGGLRVRFGRYHHVDSDRGPLPDPIVPIESPGDEAPPGARSRSLHCELYVPHDAPAGEHTGRLTLRDGGGRVLGLDVVVEVWDVTLPDFLSFLPEMNCYGLPGNERDFYRLAHVHRTVLNRVPYSQNGTVHDGCAPTWDARAKRLDWSAWDRRFGPYFDGSAFADLPRRGVPLDAFYLPLHENWPSPMEGHYNGDYWADRAFDASYRDDFVTVARLMAEHFQAARWPDTFFLFYLNGKNNFKQQGWSRGSSPWLLDEPANFQDFWALHVYGTAFHRGVNQAPAGPAKLAFRGDISRPQWQRDALDGLLDYNVVGGAVRAYPRIVFDRRQAERQVLIEYGSSNAIEDANMQPVGWCLDAWSLGTDGVLPWQTLGRAGSWQRADRLALFYPGRPGVDSGPVPSIRLKAFRRGQQDVEYLTLLSRLTGEPRWAIGQRLREELRLAAARGATGPSPAGAEDAGMIRFDRLRPQEEWAVRLRLGRVLSASHPPPERRLVRLQTPRRTPSAIASGPVADP